MLFSLLINCCNETGPEPGPTASEKLQKVLDYNLKAFNGKGVSAAIVFQNRDLWSGTSGISFGTSSITKAMIFNIGSVTKTFIAALCLQLADEGVFCLEDSLHDWLPVYPNIDYSITIKQLLNNTSGICNISDNPELWSAVFNDPGKLWTLEELLSSFLNEPYAAPGEDWFYSNTNYILLGEIIKVSTGSSVSSELRNHFLEPLGLNNTYFAIEETLPPDVAHGWFDLTGNGSYDDMSLISRNGIYSVLHTSAAIFSTAEDLARWSSALFSGNVLSQLSLDMMLYSYSTMPGTTDVECGMGVFLIGPGNNTGVKLIGYTGRTFGYLTSMFYLPDYGISVAVIINEDNTECLDGITTDLILEAINDD
ncbi:MAG: hypothetical protein AMS27_08705 [Bacteroides sp. SM23_62_1]|nr:MAG: hypothetical protein AMS27_08705 [Bacteroides sp. SM23_62_1]